MGELPKSVSPPGDLASPREAPSGYELRRRLGRGGGGEVYVAFSCVQGREVALKYVNHVATVAGERFRREVEAMRAVGPPAGPELLDQGILRDGAGYLATELIPWPSLAEVLATKATLPESAFLARAQGLLRAVGLVHDAGFVHLDLKPANFLVDESSPTARLIDFGLARRPDLGEPAKEIQAVAGTPAYMAPEQCRGEAIDQQTDIYALGVIFYEMATGRTPFLGTEPELRLAHQDHRPPRPSTFSPVRPEVEELILRCLAKDPQRRPTAQELLDAVLAASRSGGPDAKEAPPPAQVAAKAGAERRRLAVLRYRPLGDATRAQNTAQGLGGQPAELRANEHAILFDHEAAENPAQRALQAARALVTGELADQAVLDVVTATAVARADGSRRYLGRFLSPIVLPEGHTGEVLATPVAAEATGEGGWAPAGSGYVRTAGVSRASEPTILAHAQEPLLGREGELAACLDAAKRAFGGGGATRVVVTGEAGLGKTHLAACLAKELRLRWPRIRVDEARAGESLLREVLLSALALPVAPPVEGAKALLEARLGTNRRAEAWVAVGLALGWLSPSDAEVRRLMAAPGALRVAVARALGEAWAAAATKQPLAVLLDDAHRADQAVLDAIEFATRAGLTAPVYVAVFARPALRELRPEWSDTAPGRTSWALAPLSPGPAAELCRQLLSPADQVPQSAVERLLERAGGVPLLLKELVRGLKAAGAVRPRDRGEGHYLATDEIEQLPQLSLAEWLARRELGSLGPELGVHAGLLACLAEDWTLAEVAGVVEELDRGGGGHLVPLDPVAGTRRLMAHGVVVTHRRQRLSFRYPLLREVAERIVPPEAARAIHLAAYRYLQKGGPAREMRWARLGAHAAAAGLREDAAKAFQALAERAQARHRYFEAEGWYSQTLAQVDAGQTERRLSALRGRGLMRYRLSRYEDALADLAQARALAHDKADARSVADLLLDEATALDWMGDFRASRDRVEQAAGLIPRPAPPALEARLLLGRGRSANRFSDDAVASGFLEQAARLAEQQGDEGYETLVISLLMQGFVLQGLGRLAEADKALERGVALCEQRGDRLHLLTAWNNRALLRACQHDREGMLSDWSAVIAEARELGIGVSETYAEYNLGEYLYLLDDPASAQPHIVTAQEQLRRRFGESFRPVGVLLEARVALYRGDEARARELWDAIVRHQQARRAADEKEGLLLPSEQVLADLLQLGTEETTEAAWEDLERRADQHSVGQERIEVTEGRGRWALRRGRYAEAAEHLRRSEEMADRIPNAMAGRIRRAALELRTQRPS